MSRFSRALALVAAALVSGACYRVTVVASPTALAATPTVTRPWNHSFIIGLVPPAPVNVAQECPGGVQKVVTERSLVNGVAAWLTGSIYTPLQIQVACAGGRSSLGLPPELLGHPTGTIAPAPADTASAGR